AESGHRRSRKYNSVQQTGKENKVPEGVSAHHFALPYPPYTSLHPRMGYWAPAGDLYSGAIPASMTPMPPGLTSVQMGGHHPKEWHSQRMDGYYGTFPPTRSFTQFHDSEGLD
ncbi:unnamed protein product, partial [Discosporangium mesarthrocarpum]